MSSLVLLLILAKIRYNNPMPNVPSRRSRLDARANDHVTKMVLLSKLSVFAFFGLIGLIILTIVLFLWYSRDLPTPGKLVNAQEKQSTRIYDRNDTLLYSVYQGENRIYVTLDKIPKNLQVATIAVEDKNSSKHYPAKSKNSCWQFRLTANIPKTRFWKCILMTSRTAVQI